MALCLYCVARKFARDSEQMEAAPGDTVVFLRQPKEKSLEWINRLAAMWGRQS